MKYFVQELDKIRSQKHLRVTELIGTFNRNKPTESEEDSAVKQRRRASLQIQVVIFHHPRVRLRTALANFS